MCGRAAQSVRGVERAEEILRGGTATNPHEQRRGGGGGGGDHQEAPSDQQSGQQQQRFPRWGSNYDNVNMGPGMRGLVIHKDDSKGSGIVCDEMVWGLVPKSGTKTSPLPTGPSQHYSNLMFNARSDTLYDKRTFRDLALRGKTCVVAVDGFYEWKESEKSAIGVGSGKQPYYVHRSDGKPLLIAGLWTEVPTGREIGYDGKPEILTTYTLLTTDACPKLRWLHHRQPVFLWDTASAIEWMQSPTQTFEKFIAKEASSDHDELAWHPVTKKMNKTQYREKDCNVAIKIEKVPSVKSFFSQSFAAKKSTEGKTEAPAETGPKHVLEEGWKETAKTQMEQSKRQAPFSPSKAPAAKKSKKTTSSSPSPSKLFHKGKGGKPSPARKGQITSFFASKSEPTKKNGD